MSLRRGRPGEDGAPGKSAYQHARERGFSGDVDEWLASLCGKAGRDGADGQPGRDGTNGTPGRDGSDGKDGCDGLQGLRGKAGAQGQKGDKGEAGPMGPMPRHEWNHDKTRIRFEIEPGEWGEWSESLRGPPGGSGVIHTGGITEQRVIELIEELMTTDSGEQEYPHHTATVVLPGDTTVLTPAAGKALRLHWFYAVGDPDNADTPLIRVSLGSREIYRAYAIAKRQLVTGAVDAPLIINLSGSGSVAVTVIYEEVVP